MQRLTKSILETIDLSIYAQYHILRHFSAINEEYALQLHKNGGYRKTQIAKQLTLLGSKFHSSFTQDPIQLWQESKSGILALNSPPLIQDYKWDIQLHFDPIQYPNGIGKNHVSKISDLSSEERKELKQEKRGQYHVWVIEKVAPTTWQLNVIIHQNKEGQYFVRTVFPGTYAPPFPNSDWQDKEDFELSKVFWEEWCFLK